jgi:uncharacterized NAD(P)/FAD-binding protein YdhS
VGRESIHAAIFGSGGSVSAAITRERNTSVDPIEIAILGLGPWGLTVLEQLVDMLRSGPRPESPIRVHVVDPGTPGVGAFSVDEPDFLILNTPCGWHSVSLPDGARPCYPTFFEWLQRQGYRWVGDRCAVDRSGVPISPTDFVPRRLMGEYLAWSYEEIKSEAMEYGEVIEHSQAAVDVQDDSDAGPAREIVLLADGTRFAVDHVVIATGHTAERPWSVRGLNALPPYPTDRLTRGEDIPSSCRVAVRGMGLVALDVVLALTVGRGGSFIEHNSRLEYVPSGLEPEIVMFSRSGFPYCAKSSQGTLDPSATEYRPAFCTADTIAAMRPASARGLVDLRKQLLPLLYAEMQLRYYAEAARLAKGPIAARLARNEFVTAWREERLEHTARRYAETYGAFDPRQHLFVGADDRYLDSDDYAKRVRAVVDDDLAEASLPPGRSAVKAAYGVPRVLRETLRQITEFGGLTAESQLDFQRNVKNRFGRLIAGPPVERARQLVALLDAGVVRLPFGPDPRIRADDGEGVDIESRHLEIPHAERVDILIDGTLGGPTLARTTTPLLRNLRDGHRLRELRIDGVPVGSIELTEAFHPVATDGTVQSTLSIFGPLTEGARYYTAYLPSPKDPRAHLDARRWVEGVFAAHGGMAVSSSQVLKPIDADDPARIRGHSRSSASARAIAAERVTR